MIGLYHRPLPWKRCSEDELGEKAELINRVFDLIFRSDNSRAASDLLQQSEKLVVAQRGSMALLFVSNNNHTLSHFSSWFHSVDISLRQISEEEYIHEVPHEELMQRIERLFWWGQAKSLITLIVTQDERLTDLCEDERVWTTFVNRLHHKSPILQSYAIQHDLSFGLMFLDIQNMKVSFLKKKSKLHLGNLCAQNVTKFFDIFNRL